jgi:putative ABC transport system permease protein
MLSSLLWGLRNLWTRRGQAMAQAVLVAVGMGAAMGVARLEQASDKALVDELEGVDLILAAVGSPTQALLASVFHLDDPTGNVDSAWANQWMQHPAVARALPLLEQGRLPSQPFEVLAGARAAQQLNLKMGSVFHGSHGTEGDAGDHEHHPYTVVGIGNARGQVVDGLLMTPLASVWAVHEDAPADYTAVLLQTKSPMAALFLPRSIRSSGMGMAVSPPLEVNRLRTILDQGSQLFSIMSALITVVALVAIVLMWWNFSEERRAELALLRANGATAGQLYGFILAPFAGVLLVGWGIAWMAQFVWTLPFWPLEIPGGQWIPLDGYMLVAGLLSAALLALVPTYQMLRTPIHTALLDA